MKKLMFMLVTILAVIIGTMTNAKADSLSLHLVGNDNLQPSYGLSYEFDNGPLYASLEDVTNKGFATNTALAISGFKAGPINMGLVAGAQIQSASGTTLGMVGAEVGISADIAGPVFVKENNRVLRGAGGTSDGQVDLGLGINF